MAQNPKIQNSKKDNSDKDSMDNSSDDLDFVVVKDNSGSASNDWSFSNLKFSHSVIGNLLIDKAKEISTILIKEIGDNKSAPRIHGINELYRDAMKIKAPRDYVPIIQTFREHIPGSLNDLLKSKFTYEVDAHKATSANALDSIKIGSSISTAVETWELAEKIYQENIEDAEDAFKEAVYSARSDSRLSFEKTYSNLNNEIISHENYYNQSIKVAAAVDKYCKSMSTATAALVVGFNSFTTSLTQAWTQMAQSESTYINSRKKSSSVLWASIKASYNKAVPNNRNSI